MGDSKTHKEQVAFVRALAKLMQASGIHELAVGDVHIAMSPVVAAQRKAAASQTTSSVPFTQITDSELLFWSSGGEAPKPGDPVESSEPPPEAVEIE